MIAARNCSAFVRTSPHDVERSERADDRPDALEIFRARAEARALLVRAGEIDLHDAVDGLQNAATAYGLVDSIGQDAVQAIMAEAFANA